MDRGIPKGIWIQHWQGPWSLLSCSYLGREYTVLNKKYLKTGLRYCVILVKNGRSACYFFKDDVDRFGKDLARIKNIPRWTKDMKSRADDVMEAVKGRSFENFIKAFDDYCPPHIGVKKVIDYLDGKDLKRYSKKLEEARVYAEPVYSVTEPFMEKYAKSLKKDPKEILSTTREEFEDFLKTKKKPKGLSKRRKRSALIFIDGEETLILGKDVDRLEEFMLGDSRKVQGKTAYKGKATGTARVILDPAKVKKFVKGDILITGMTRPEYVTLFEKAGAVVTDAGGLLCHAAITAREMKKPCIVGTGNATKVLKDGDKVEVDASKGTVKIISKKK